MDPNNRTYEVSEFDLSLLLNLTLDLRDFSNGLRLAGQTVAACMMSDTLDTMASTLDQVKHNYIETKAEDPFAQLKLLHAAGYPIQIYQDTEQGWIDCNPQWGPNRKYRVATHALPKTVPAP